MAHLSKELRILEPFFQTPLTSENGILTIRKDSYGKGHFGASRNGGRTHKGIDVQAPVGTPILATKSGRIARSEEDKGYGLFVEIKHPGGLWTRYAHLDRLDVRKGQWVEIGQVIGLCGKTGNAKNPHMKPHLHYEIRDSALAPLDPQKGLLDPSLKLQY